MNDKLIYWLIQSDPSIRWQVMQDIQCENEKDIINERKKIECEGWGKRILSYQDEDGKWGGNLYNKKWISTTYSLYLLKEFGLLPGNEKALKGCNQLFNNGIFNNEEIRFSRNQAIRDIGVTGLILGILCYFNYQDVRIENIVNFLRKMQNEDGSWFYDDKTDASKYSFDATLIVLKGLREFQKQYPCKATDIADSQRKGNEFLLKHRLYKNSKTGQVINKKWELFSFPCYWFYDALVSLDYFREINYEKDNRLLDGIGLINKKQDADGKWKLQNKHSGQTFFEMEKTGKQSRWNTLRCLRVLKWWNH